MANFVKKPIKCKDCPYYTGIQCHGHGEYWGSCQLIDTQKSFLSKMLSVYKYDIKLKRYYSVWVEALRDDSDCLLFEIEEVVK